MSFDILGRIGNAVSRRPVLWTLVFPLVLYAILVSVAGVKMRDQINPDGVAYVCLARHLAEGRASDSVCGAWSPLISWCIAPFLVFGMDGLHAARLVLAVWGGILIVGIHFFLRRFTRLPPLWAAAAMAAAVPWAVHWAVYVITPDIIAAACATFYFGIVAGPGLLSRRRLQLAAGACGGVAYLAKAYMLPFFLVHFAATLILRILFDPDEERTGASGRGPGAAARNAANAGAGDPESGVAHEGTAREGMAGVLPEISRGYEGRCSVADVRSRMGRMKAMASAWVVGMAAFAAVSAPWIATLSVKYGRPVFTTAPSLARAQVPPPRFAGALSLSGLVRPPEPHRYIIEVWAVSYTHL
ncbi:MAG: hypothetical protein N3A38_16365, partial [Planctomycetota bacterium]|nr:hypothetical protein [Planctomycetota bacterium]